MKRKYPVGAEYIVGEGVHFRIWAPGKNSVEVVFFEQTNSPLSHFINLEKSSNNYFEGIDSSAKPGTLYKYRLNKIDDFYPDPASRFQPYGPHGPSEVIDSSKFKWTDDSWKGNDPQDLVIYEMHIGTFTSEGDWKSAEDKLSYLADTGINMIEVMPIAEFPGNFGWGYDGVSFFAPSRLYGRPDDFKSFINKAHSLSISVILDVVYNHLGPDGNYLGKYSNSYTTEKYKTDWGAAINYDGEDSKEVREFFTANAVYWIEEYHLDGLRLDATQDIYDDSETHILAEIHDIIRRVGKKRKTFIVTENEPQNSILVRERNKGGYGFDAMWNDDFHHSAMVALTGRNEAYYTDYFGKPQEFISSLKYGFLYQGQIYKWQKKRRGKPAIGLKPNKFVNFIQNHDQIANSGKGLRVHQLTSPGKYRAVTALLLLAPQIPMLFQGQEFGSSNPFFYFADHNKDIAEAVQNGRKEFLSQFPSLASPEISELLADPGSMSTFLKSKLDFTEVINHSEIYKLHKDLLKLRREDPAIRNRNIDGAVLGSDCFLIRYFAEEDKLLLVNLGVDLNLNPAPEPLMAPPEKKIWDVLWSSEHPSYGGSGTGKIETENNWMIPGNAAVLLQPVNIKAAGLLQEINLEKKNG